MPTEVITLRQRLRDLDRKLVFATLIAMLLGLVLIYSADHSLEQAVHFNRQLVVAAMGVLLITLLAVLPTRVYYSTAFLAYGFAIALLLLAMTSGIVGLGARRWISIAGLKLQPSEAAKIAFILAAARVLSQQHDFVSHWRNVGLVAALAIVPTALVLAQPDLGTSSLFPVIAAGMLAWLGLPLQFFILFLLPAVSLFWAVNAWVVTPLIVAGMLFLWRTGIRWVSLTIVLVICLTATVAAPRVWNHLEPYQQRRLISFLEPSTDPLGSGYQIIQSKVAVGSGGFVGMGYLKGTQTQLRFLPEQHTDFIFALAGEEFGFVGTTFTLVVLLVILWRGFTLAGQTKSQFAGLVAAGLTTMLAYHIIINIGMAVGLLPVTGLPLPFLSYGGTFLLTCLAAGGILLSVGIHRRER